MITFHQPLWIAAGLACAVLFWLLWRHYEQVRAVQIRNFAAEPLIGALTANLSPARRRLKKWLLLGTIMLCFTALARPQYGHRWVDVKHRGIDILFALDTSKSMLAEDVRPNRLERSRLAILDFVSTTASLIESALSWASRASAAGSLFSIERSSSWLWFMRNQ